MKLIYVERSPGFGMVIPHKFLQDSPSLLVTLPQCAQSDYTFVSSSDSTSVFTSAMSSLNVGLERQL